MFTIINCFNRLHNIETWISNENFPPSKFNLLVEIWYRAEIYSCEDVFINLICYCSANSANNGRWFEKQQCNKLKWSKSNYRLKKLIIFIFYNNHHYFCINFRPKNNNMATTCRKILHFPFQVVNKIEYSESIFVPLFKLPSKFSRASVSKQWKTCVVICRIVKNNFTFTINNFDTWKKWVLPRRGVTQKTRITVLTWAKVSTLTRVKVSKTHFTIDH